MTKKNLDFSEKVVLVTGGSRGLGKHIALAFAERGANVVICGRKQESLDKTVDEFKKKGFSITAKATHIGRSDQVEALFGVIDETFGKLNILINNVGMNLFTPSLVDMDEGLWDKIIDSNLTGAFLVTRQAAKMMKKEGGGKIVNISSVGARRVAVGMGVYCVAKSGLEMMSRVFAVELAKDGINVNVVAPGMVRTDFSKPFWSDENRVKEINKSTPMGRIAETEDVVGSVLFLSSDLADFITGDIITVAGGATA